MQIGVTYPQTEIETDHGAVKHFAQAVEAMGFTHILAYDHVVGANTASRPGWNRPYRLESQFHDPFVLFSFMAGATAKIGFVTGILILTQRQTVLVAKQAACLDVLCNGRFRLGVGTGWNEVEYEALGVPFRARGARLAEQVDLLRALWREDSLTFNGKMHQVTWASINPRPAKPIPIWFGGSAPAALERCATHGDGWMPLMGPSDKARACLEQMRTAREGAGLSWDTFGVQGQAQYAGGSPDRWVAHATKWKELGASHIAVATHNAGSTNVDGHLGRVKEYFDAVRSIG